MDILYYITVPIMTSINFIGLSLLKKISNNNEKILRLFPLIAAGFGALLGMIIFFSLPSLLSTENFFVAFFKGGASGLAATGTHQLFKQLTKSNEIEYNKKLTISDNKISIPQNDAVYQHNTIPQYGYNTVSHNTAAPQNNIITQHNAAPLKIDYYKCICCEDVIINFSARIPNKEETIHNKKAA
ncbi:MAG: phage holin family protein [Firmicutes bacterium]|nr:phage holin family protein [Bacillota bacterium]